jgi:peptidyl-prolyl cis-trans isomerase A (cyclophilin A)
MITINSRPAFGLAALLTVLALAPRNSEATVVEFQTVMGTFEVNLYDNATPQTVANFLAYVNGLAYTNSIYHRSASGFVLQGGGFTYDGTLPLVDITANAPVMNEPEFSNVRGTIAMAKLGGDPNSATNQWFFNLANNSANLDVQNGGFTVFGEVVGNGMDIIDAIAALPTYDFGGALTSMPLRNYTTVDFTNSVPPDGTHFVTISAIVVSDPTVDSAAGLNPPPNTLINAPPPPAPAPSGGGGGSFGILSLIGLLLVRRLRFDGRSASMTV